MQRVLIIGFGSDLRGDDALGPRAATLLAQRPLGNHVRVLSCPSLTPEFAHDVAQAGLVIFIDCDAKAEPGRITRRDVEAIDDAGAAMVHFLDPPALLGWASLLYGAAPRAVMFTMGGATFECADELSPSVAAAMPVLIERVAAEINGKPSDLEARHA